VRRVLWPGLVLVLLGYLAGIGLERLDVGVLENVRYSYEPVLGLCAVLGVGVAALPARSRGVALALFVVVHAVVLDGNRESWLRAAAVYERMQREVVELARSTRAPVRVFDAPGVYEGAFAYLNGYTEFLFWQQTAAPGTDLRGGVASTLEWRSVLEQLAAAAAAKGTVDAQVVRWHDGALVPFVFDASWPVEPFPGTVLRYARIARAGPFADSRLPVDVLVETTEPIELLVHGDTWSGEPAAVPAAAGPQPVRLWLPLPATTAGQTVAVALHVRRAGDERHFALGSVTPVAR
jgi:hypothetical protein